MLSRSEINFFFQAEDGIRGIGVTGVQTCALPIWMYKRVIFGEVGNRHVAELTDANARELLVLGLLAIAVLWLGLHPAPFTEIMHASVSELLKHVANSKL